MVLKDVRIGFALTGSFCTFEKTFTQVKALIAAGAQLFPIFSYNVYNLDTRFYPAHEVREFMEDACGRKIMHTLNDVEPIGPKNMLDLVIIAPCTGNSLAKLANGIIDTPVIMAAKSHLRNQRPVLLALTTNDGLSIAAKNIGILLNDKNIYFVPFGQDDHVQKPNSLSANLELLPEAAHAALQGKQLQPILV